MQFGNPIVGGSGDLIRPAIRSPNYVEGEAGWSINRDGSAEFAGSISLITTGTSIRTVLSGAFGIQIFDVASDHLIFQTSMFPNSGFLTIQGKDSAWWGAADFGAYLTDSIDGADTIVGSELRAGGYPNTPAQDRLILFSKSKLGGQNAFMKLLKETSAAVYLVDFSEATLVVPKITGGTPGAGFADQPSIGTGLELDDDVTVPTGKTFLAPAACAKVTATSDVSCANNTVTAIPFAFTAGTDKNDFGLWASGQPTRITVNRTGWWSFKASSGMSGVHGATSLHSKIVAFRVNGVTLRNGSQLQTTWGASVSSTYVAPITDDMYLTAGDYVEVVCFQNSGAAVNSTRVNGAGWFTAHWMHT